MWFFGAIVSLLLLSLYNLTLFYFFRIFGSLNYLGMASISFSSLFVTIACINMSLVFSISAFKSDLEARRLC